MKTTAYRYQFQPYKGPTTRHTCPNCGKARAFTRYLDTKTDELLPEEFGRCNRSDNCGHHLSPYHATTGASSYADEVYHRERQGTGEPKPSRAAAPRRNSNPEAAVFSGKTHEFTPSRRSSDEKSILTVPETVFARSLGDYETNVFARLLRQHFGLGVAAELLDRFQIGTSSYWPGATVFWLTDEQGRVRGGQVALFEANGHTAKRPLPDGEERRCTSWVHTAIATLCQRQGKPRPAWLDPYIEQADFAPCLFGLPQLKSAPPFQPVALVEAPKTAVLCTPYFPQFVWLAVGALDWLSPERIAPLRGRRVVLFPDLSKPKPGKPTAFEKWSAKADGFRAEGFQITVSDFLEAHADEQRRTAGGDLADYLLDLWEGYPPSWGI